MIEVVTSNVFYEFKKNIEKGWMPTRRILKTSLRTLMRNINVLRQI